MSYQIKVGNKILKDTFYSLSPVNWVLRVLVLSNVRREQNKFVQCWSWVATSLVLTTMLIINLIFLAFKVQRFERQAYGQIRFSDSLQLTYLLGFAEYIVDLFYVYKTRDLRVKYLKFYVNIDKVLTVPDFSKIRMKNLTFVVFFMASFTTSSLFDYVAWSFVYGWIEPTLYSLDYIYGFISSLTVLDVISNVMQIEFRVKEILGCLEEYYASSLAFNGGMDDIDFGTVEKRRIDTLGTVSRGKSYGVLSLSKYYVMLLEQVDFINTAYGVRLGAFCLNLLIFLVYLTNIIIRLILGQFPISYPACHFSTASTVLRTSNFAFVLSALVSRCEQTYKKCNGIVRLVDLTVVNRKIHIFNKYAPGYSSKLGPSVYWLFCLAHSLVHYYYKICTKYSPEIRSALDELRALVLSRRVRFHGANFFTLDYPLLVSLASVVITYSIILLQSMR